MFKDYKSYMNTLSSHSEDTCYACDKFMFVLDGASGLSDKRLTKDKSDAYWLVNYLRDHLIKELHNDSLSLATIVSDGIKLINEELTKMNEGNTLDLSIYPSATCSIVRYRNQFIEYLVMGDSPIIIEFNDGKMSELFEYQIKDFDYFAIHEAKRISEDEKIPFIEAVKEMFPLIRDNQMSANQFDTFHSIREDDTAPYGAIQGSIDVHLIKTIVVLSDGFSQYYDTLQLAKDYKEFIEILKTTSVEEVYKQITNRQLEDKDITTYLRYKISDDASICMASIQE